MAAEDRILKILLQLKADTADVSKVTGGLKEIEAQAVKTQSAVSASRAGGAGNVALQERALAIQKEHGVTAEYALKVAGRRMAAEEAVTIVQAKGVEVLRQQGAAIESNVARMGGMGNAIGLSVIAGFELYRIISDMREEAAKLSKETSAQTEELSRQVDSWIQLAKHANDFNDTVQLGEKIAPQIAAMAAKLAEFRDQELTKTQRFVDAITAMWSAIPGYGPRFNQAAKDTAFAERRANAELELKAANQLFNVAQQTAEQWQKFKTLPPADGITFYTAKVSEARAEMAKWENLRNFSPDAYGNFVKAAADLESYQKHVNELTKAQEKLTKEEASETRRSAHQAINSLLREQANLLASLGQQQQLIEGNTTLSAEAKQEQLRNLYLREQGEILTQIAIIRATIKQIQAVGSPEEQAQVEQLTAKLQALQFQYASLGQKTQTLTFGGGLQADLANWVNGFGTASQQIAGMIEGSINAALQGTNQLLVDAIFQTGDWRQTLVGVEKQILNLFLTWIEQYALQKAASLLGITATTGAQVASGAAITAANAPAAAATSIASSGTTAVIGTVAAIAAIGAIIAALMGGFRKGGFTGEGHPDEVAGVVHRREHVFDESSTSRLGRGNLEALRRGEAGIVHMARGGRVQSIGPTLTNFGPYEGPPGSALWRDGSFDMRGNPHVPGNIALTSDLARGHHYGDIVTFRTSDGQTVTGRFVDVTHGRLSNRVDVWQEENPGGTARGTGGDDALADANNSAPLPGAERGGGPIVELGPRGGGPARGVGQPTVQIFRGGPGALGGDAFGTGGIYGGLGFMESSGSRPSPHLTTQGPLAFWVNGQYAGGGGYDYGPSVRGSVAGNAPGSLGYTDIPAGGPWEYGGADAPVGSIVGVTSSGQTIYQGPSGERRLGGVGQGSVPSVVAGGRASAVFAAGFGSMAGVGQGARSNTWTAQQRNIAAAQSRATQLNNDMHGGAPLPFQSQDEITPIRTVGGGTSGVATATLYANEAARMHALGYGNWTAANALRNPSGANMFTGPGHAAGVRLPGGPSTTDTIPAMLAAGEVVISAPNVAHYDSTHPGLMDGLLNRTYHDPVMRLAEGGRVGQMRASGGGGGGGNAEVHVFNFTDERKLAEAVARSSANRKMIIDTVSGERINLGFAG